MGGPRVAFIGEQVDARGGPDWFVVVGLDVFQPGPMQHMVDIVGMSDRYETPSRATESGDIVSACPAEEAAVGIEPDGDRLARHRQRGQPRRRCRHDSTVWVTGRIRNGSIGQRVGSLGQMASTTWSPDLRAPDLRDAGAVRGGQRARRRHVRGPRGHRDQARRPGRSRSGGGGVGRDRGRAPAPRPRCPMAPALGVDVGSRFRLTHSVCSDSRRCRVRRSGNSSRSSMRYFSLTHAATST